MKKLIFAVLFVCGLFSVNALDLIALKNGDIIEGKVVEISATEIRYRRANNLTGPMIVISRDSVYSIKYENGTTEVMGGSPAGGTPATTAPSTADGTAEGEPVQKQGIPPALQTVLNNMPAIPIVGNRLKFIFNDDKWTSTLNGESFSAGTIVYEETDVGGKLTLQQTHIWPGTVGKAAGKTAGRIASFIPGGGTVAGALNTAGDIAGAAGAAIGAVESTGTEMVLEYKAGPPASLRLVSTRNTKETAQKDESEESTNSTAMNPDRINFGINVNPFGLLWMGPSICLEFTKGNFNSEVNLIYPAGIIMSIEGISNIGFGTLLTFNWFKPNGIGGFYLGGGIGHIYYDSLVVNNYNGSYTEKTVTAHSLIVGVNVGHKFVTPSGIYFRAGGFAGFNFGFLWQNDQSPVYVKPELAIGVAVQ